MTYQFVYKKIAEALYNSLVDEAYCKVLGRSISNDPVECKEGMLKYFDYSMQEAQKYGELYLPDGKYFGASLWSKPKSSDLAKQLSLEKRAFIQKHLGDASLKKYDSIMDYMEEKVIKYVPKNSWYLSIVGVSPEFQNQGLGVTLIKPILAKTDKISVPTYLETYTPRNRSFYRRLGYQDLISFVEPEINSEYWIMIREPIKI